MPFRDMTAQGRLFGILRFETARLAAPSRLGYALEFASDFLFYRVGQKAV
jgi:hypothetical protein